MAKIKQINGYWVDENNNRWDIEIYTEEQAEEFSKSLVNCYNCYNCCDCHDCDNCYDCENCTHCLNCRNCNNSKSCNSCYDCDNCDWCYKCHRCNYCYECREYKNNPQRYVTDIIGSKDEQLTFYCGQVEYDEDRVQVARSFCNGCGVCLEDFEEAVKLLKTHKDNGLYREQYLQEIEKVRILFGLNNPLKYSLSELDDLFNRRCFKDNIDEIIKKTNLMKRAMKNIKK